MESEVRELLSEELKDAYSAEKQALLHAEGAENGERSGAAGRHSDAHRADPGANRAGPAGDGKT